MLEAGRQHPDEAAQHLREGLKRNPHDGVGHLVLGHVLRDQGQYAAARDEYRAALDCQLRPRNAQAARRALALVNARLTGD